MHKSTLGLLGLGSQTTLYYISELNRLFHNLHDGYSTCPFIMWNTNFDKINSLLPDISEELNALSQQCIHEVEKLDVDYILIPNITLHESIDQITVKKNLLHPVHLTVSKLVEQKVQKIVLMGSEHTMNSDYIRSIFQASNIEIEIPAQDDRIQIDNFRKYVYEKKENKELILNYHKTIAKYTESNYLVLACTELSIFKPKNNNKLLDMVQIQIDAAIDQL